MIHVACCSFGKDSLAQIIVGKQHNEPIDLVVYSEVMFTDDISGEYPEHRDFIYNVAIPKLKETYGLDTIVLRADKTMWDDFHTVRVRGDNAGKLRGFPIPGLCNINRDCKVPPMKEYLKLLGDDVVQYIGIASDEEKRLARLDGVKQISLLAKYGITEEMATDICREAGLLSPIYDFAKRNGCFFCPNSSDKELRHLYHNHPDLWATLRGMQQEENTSRENFTRSKTIFDYEEQFQSEMNENKEDVIWKTVVGFPNYEVSNKGIVRNKNTGYILKRLLNSDGYYYVDVYTNDHKAVHKRIHRLVADAFYGPQPLLVVNHIDGNKLNNDVSNIEWVTAEENSRLASLNDLYKTKKVRIVETGETFKSIKDCAKAINSHPSDISHAIGGRNDGRVKGLHFELVGDAAPPKKEFLRDYQMDAVYKMRNGCILNGGVGSGKSRTGLYYYFKENGGSINPDYIPMKNPQDLYIITTAMKRDSAEWEGELANYLLSTNPELDYYKGLKIVIDSWNNIKKYTDVTNAFFLFDEDRVTGYGVWVKSFLKIAKNNKWVILSATAGDTWLDYIPVFIANGFYKNKTEFIREHVIYSRFTKYPKVDRYVNTGRLIKQRNYLLIDMDFKRKTVSHHEDVYVKYDIAKYKDVMRLRWDPYKNEPIQNASMLCYILRKVVNLDDSRQVALLELFEKHPRMIVFYNFDYELETLKKIFNGTGVPVAEWNGHAHQPIPDEKTWVYLVQYTAGAEGWNCVKTDTIVFYSQNYSYKIMQQAAGRTDRMNTPYTDLYYYHIKTRSGIDLAISKALNDKKQFNASRFVKW